MRDYYVYFLSNNAMVLYIGVTNDLDVRMFQHIRERDPSSFAARYNLDRLVYYEDYPTPREAIAREKQLKGWSRERKKQLIRRVNPEWRNLMEEINAGRTDPSTGSG